MTQVDGDRRHRDFSDAMVLRLYRARYLCDPDPHSARDASRMIEVGSWVRTVRAAGYEIVEAEDGR